MGLIQNKVTVSQPNSHVVVKNAGGLRGLTGETGPQGPQGVPGEAATVTAGTTTTLPAGSDATVQNVGSTSAAIFNFGIPKGDKGDTGESGAAATISVGSTSTLPAGSSATVTNSGTSSAAVFDFGIPKGDKGDTGDTGADGYSPSATVTKTGDTATITITDKDGTTTASISDGSTPTVNDGTLTIQKNGTTVQTFSADQASNVTANITVPTQFSELSGTVSSSQIEDEAITTGSVSGTGTNITLAGTMEGGAIESVEMYGDTEQTTYSGKNLLNVNFTSLTSGGVTITNNGDGTITASGTTTGTVACNLSPASINNLVLQNGRTYTQRVEVISGNFNLRVVPAFRNSGGTTTYNYFVNNQSKTTTDTMTCVGYDMFTSTSYLPVGSSVNFTIRVWVEEGSDLSSPYEPYVGGTASPNPDYPQEVQTVTGEQSVEVRGDGKNWFNKDKTPEYRYIDGNGNWATGTYPDVNQEWSVTGNETFTISFSNIVGASAYVRFAEYNADGTFIRRTLVNTTPTTITLSANTRKIIWSVDVSQSFHFDNLQIELGSTATTYEPYKGVTKTVNLGKNLCNPSDIESVFVYASFNRAAYGAGDTSVVIPVLPNTDYTISTLEAQARYRGGFSDSIPVSGGGDVTVYNGFNKDSQLVSVTTNSGDHKYLIVNATDLTKIQIEKGSAATTYAPYFTPIELCKIGDYQDYIYKSGDDWYLHKETGKHIFTSDSDTWNWDSSTPRLYVVNLPQLLGIKPVSSNADTVVAMSDKFIVNSTNYVVVNKNNGFSLSGAGAMSFVKKSWTSSATAIAEADGTTVYYALATPTDTQITNADLIAQLEDLLSATTYSGTTYITVSGDLASPLEVVAEADSKLAPGSVYGAAIKDGAVSVDKIADLKALADALAPYLN